MGWTREKVLMIFAGFGLSNKAHRNTILGQFSCSPSAKTFRLGADCRRWLSKAQWCENPAQGSDGSVVVSGWDKWADF